MKQIRPFLLVAALSLASFGLMAQAEKQSTIPRWVPDNGYWVLESNIHQPLDHVIRFYNNDNTLIYTETVTGMKINLKKKKVKMKLKIALESALTAWEKNKIPEENKAYVSTAFR
ncbi:MAG: hypothetical protein E6H09_19550 [Bacteroidetes bacterium]|jgi:hypothetical protein|nr:MAG: hypothetical protein E6H09_19550 [Bacteroidota bacterium]